MKICCRQTMNWQTFHQDLHFSELGSAMKLLYWLELISEIIEKTDIKSQLHAFWIDNWFFQDLKGVFVCFFFLKEKWFEKHYKPSNWENNPKEQIATERCRSNSDLIMQINIQVLPNSNIWCSSVPLGLSVSIRTASWCQHLLTCKGKSAYRLNNYL